MIKLGTWPEDKTYISWMTQRLANRAPEYTHARRWPYSIVQQILNPIGSDIQRVTQQLTEHRNNIFLSSSNIDLISQLYKVELGIGMKFNYSQNGDSSVYDIPKVYGTIKGTEYELTIAHHNNIETLCYLSLPSRIEGMEESYSYEEVIPRMLLSELPAYSPNPLTIGGHLYITIRGNTTWEYRGIKKIYYPKVFIKGITRKGTECKEAIPIKFNGTFKTINQWKSVEEIFVSYMDDTSEISVEVLPFDRDDTMDNRNLVVSANGVESWRFLSIGERTWGSTLLSTGYTVSELSIIQSGMDEKDTEYEIELCNSNNENLDITGILFEQTNDYLVAIDNTKLYVFNTKLPYPDMKKLSTESTNTKMELWADRWVYPRDSVAYVFTDIMDISTIPWQYRWSLEDPDGNIYYLDDDGTKTLNSSLWTWNKMWERGAWEEIGMPILLDKTGTYIVTIDCLYSDPDQPKKDYTLTTRFLLYVPKVIPEVELDLPLSLQNSDGIVKDSDGQIWFKKDNSITRSSLYYDYFMTDYSRNIIWLKEDYSSVRVVL